MRHVLALILAAATVWAAVFLCVAHLKMHGHYHCAHIPGLPGRCYAASSYWVVGRYVWQIPVAIVIAVLGLGGAVAVARRA